jgi:class 3 adenylate cyclase
MKCPQCQHDNPQGARFCEECATSLARTCSSCGTALSATAKFCHACAHPTVAVAGAPSRSPDSYTPKHLVEKILTSKAALEGERKQVTVLFADLKGSMELLADRDPEEARQILDPVLELMMEAVHRYEGTVNQVMGDGIMALFRRAARPRGPRSAGVLRGASDAGEREEVRGRGAAFSRGVEARQREAEASKREAEAQEQATAEILRIIRQSPTDMRPVMDAVAENAARVCGAADALMFQLDGDEQRFVAHFGSLEVTTPPVR